MARMNRVLPFVGCLAAGLSAFVAMVLACAPAPLYRIAVPALSPASDNTFLDGSVGVIRPTFTRRYLVMTYRRLSGRVQGEDAMPPEPAVALEWPRRGQTQWLQARLKVRKEPPPLRKDYGFQMVRQYHQYLMFENCTNDALLTAAHTLEARVERFGPNSPQVGDWLTAQDTVFSNCWDGPLQLPAAVPANADPFARADRAYQTAAAYFYGMQYDKAETAFRAIGDDKSSAWRPWGRYLAARALIRRATLVAEGAESEDLFARADRELEGVEKDPSLLDMHERATRLRAYVVIHRFPARRFHELSARLTSAEQVQSQDLFDYQWLFDTQVDAGVSYGYVNYNNPFKRLDLDALRRDDDMTDWILVMQGWGDPSRQRALERWRATKAPHWLVAVMWKLGADDAEVPAVMDAAAKLPRDSPTFATLAFLRVRLLIERNDKDAARALLAQLPDTPSDAFPADAINLLRGERFLLARNLDELLRLAPRLDAGGGEDWSFVDLRDQPAEAAPLLDSDAVTTFNERLPVARLADAAGSPNAGPFRSELALAAWTRAVLTGSDAVALRLAKALEETIDLTSYTRAPTGAKRHFAAIYFILKHPGMSPYLNPDERQPADRLVRDELDHQSYNWWCTAVRDRFGAAVVAPAARAGAPPRLSFPHFEVLELPASFPDFLSASERRTLEAERAALAKVGAAANYLAGEAVNWARAEPKNPLVAEALARAVEGTRWGACSGDDTGARSKLAFETLHRLFPNSEWAKRTKYWYRGRY